MKSDNGKQCPVQVGPEIKDHGLLQIANFKGFCFLHKCNEPASVRPQVAWDIETSLTSLADLKPSNHRTLILCGFLIFSIHVDSKACDTLPHHFLVKITVAHY